MLKPIEQIQMFLNWFCYQGVATFDIHVRKPGSPNEDYKTGNWIWLTHNENVSIKGIRSKLLSWIRMSNAQGSDIYFRPHKDSVHPIIFLDDVPTGKAIKVAKKYTTCVVETSRNNTQIWLATDKALDKDERRIAQKSLSAKGYTDPGSISGDHLGRLCGVKSQKHSSWINLIKISSEKSYTPIEDSKSNISPPTYTMANNYLINESITLSQKMGFNKGGVCASKKISSITDSSPSGKEFGWVLGMFRAGIEYATIKEKLYVEAINRGKPNAKKYVEYTLQKAIAMVK